MSKGFTLIELMIVVAIIAIIAAIAIPQLLRSRISSNETAAIGTLTTLRTVEAMIALAASDRGWPSDHAVEPCRRSTPRSPECTGR